MKIKEVAKITGLTEKTIRFYEEKQLYVPEVQMIGDRRFREYTEENVKDLISIANLRKAFFTIEEIKTMKDEPEQIPQVISGYKSRIEQEIKAKTAIANALARAQLSSQDTIESIVEKITPVVSELKLPKADIKPSFLKLDREYSCIDLIVKHRIYTKYSILPKKITNLEMFILACIWDNPRISFTDLVHECGKRGIKNSVILKKTVDKMCKRHLISNRNGGYIALTKSYQIAPELLDRFVQAAVAGSPNIFVYGASVPLGVTSQGYGVC